MKTFLRVVIFSLLVIGGFVLFAIKYIPPIQPAPPPAEESYSGAMTMDQFVALGEKIFEGKGTCTLCHNATVKRAPLLVNTGDPNLPSIGVRSTTMRLKDPKYHGKAKTAEEYIYESMVEPSAYVVAGFGVKGTNDTESPMPVVTSGAIGLSEFEARAVVAYLLSSSGVENTVEIPKGKPAEEKKEVAGPAKTAAEAFGKYGCGACHKIAGVPGAQGTIGPDLTHLGSQKNAEYIARKCIIDPNAVITEGYVKGYPPNMMPQDFKDKLTAGELEMMVKHLAKSK